MRRLIHLVTLMCCMASVAGAGVSEQQLVDAGWLPEKSTEKILRINNDLIPDETTITACTLYVFIENSRLGKFTKPCKSWREECADSLLLW